MSAPPPFKIGITASEERSAYRIDGRRVDFTALSGRFATMNPERTIVISCDPNSRHDKLIRLLDELDHKPFWRLNVVNTAVPFKR